MYFFRKASVTILLSYYPLDGITNWILVHVSPDSCRMQKYFIDVCIQPTIITTLWADVRYVICYSKLYNFVCSPYSGGGRCINWPYTWVSVGLLSGITYWKWIKQSVPCLRHSRYGMCLGCHWKGMSLDLTSQVRQSLRLATKKNCISESIDGAL